MPCPLFHRNYFMFHWRKLSSYSLIWDMNCPLFQVQPDIGFSSPFSGPHCSPHVDRISHVVSPGQGASSSWRINPLISQSVEQPQTFTSTLQMQIPEQRQILAPQQVTLSSLTETLQSIQDDLKHKKEV